MSHGFGLRVAVLCCAVSFVAAAGPSPDRALLEIREIEDHRRTDDARLKQHLASRDRAVVRAALVAAGRIGDTHLLPQVLQALTADSSSVQAAAAFALGLLGGEEARLALEARLASETSEASRNELISSLGRVGTAASFQKLFDIALLDRSGDTRAYAARALGQMFRRMPTPDPLPAELIPKFFVRSR
jgi:HEAT repeat protein